MHLVPRLGRLALALVGLFLGLLIVVYFAVPQIYPCSLLARVLPPALLPYNPHVVDPAFTPLPGARALWGQFACATYRIEVPAAWNGDLVVYAHGFRGGGSPKLTITNLPVREEAIRQGFAWGASSYRANGYNPQDGVLDTLLLIEQFKRQVGPPQRIFIYGSSMGGHVVVESLEKYPVVYDGGLAECGAVSGAGQLDYLMSVNAVADYLAGVDMYAPANSGLAAQLGLIRDSIYPVLGAPPAYVFDENDLLGAVLPAPQVALTAKGLAYRNAQIHLGGGYRPFAEEGFGPAYKLTIEAARAIYGVLPRLASAGSNAETVYQLDPGFEVDAATLNASVQRIPPDPTSRTRFAFTGKIQDPLLTIHNTGDLFVPIANEQIYRRLTKAAGSDRLLVQRAVRRFLHCDFTIQERNRAFNDLVLWVKDGDKPDGEDLLGPLLDVGRRWTDPLRTDDPGHP